MPVVFVAVKPGHFSKLDQRGVYKAAQSAALSACNITGKLELDDVVVIGEEVHSVHDWLIHLRVSVKRTYFANLNELELVELREDARAALLEQLCDFEIPVKEQDIKIMIELIDRY